MKFNKYIVTTDKNGRYGFCAGHVEFHRELASIDELSKGLVDGGGMFKVDEEKKQIVLYGKSEDFGYPKNQEEAFSQCCNLIKTEIAYAVSHGGEVDDFSDYKVVYVDELGNEHSVEQKAVQGTPEYRLWEKHSLWKSVAPTVEPYVYSDPIRVSKHRGGRFEPKNAEKKKKAKRRAQKKARRR